jgi:prepilin-type processing-associated H-X9-DG protein
VSRRPPRPRRRAARRGRVLAKALVLLLLLYVAVSALYRYLVALRVSTTCAHHLRTIYRALERYEVDRGQLPAFDFFPDNPLEDPTSLFSLLGQHGVKADAFTCPAMPASYNHLGLTYVWNVRLSGRPLPRHGPPVWMLVEVTALGDGDVPPPHLGAFNVLYTDGSVRRVHHPLRELPGL